MESSLIAIFRHGRTGVFFEMDVTRIDHEYLVKLQVEFSKIFHEAREKNWIVCVPKPEALVAARVDEQFVATHMLRPSPTLKG